MASAMSSNPSSAGSTADPGKAQPAPQPPNTRQSLRNLWRVIVELWWRFFDWLAVVSWKTLLLVYALLLLLAAMLNRPTAFFLFVIVSAIIKIVAGGKRRAELTAQQATQRADTEQLERTALEARMQALQAQIEPHFLFNTLASVQFLTETDPPKAGMMLGHLLSYLRAALPQLRSDSTTLGQEAELTGAYLSIMQMRMGTRLSFVIDVPPELAPHRFPPMMLISVVENAVKNGIEPQAAGGTIRVQARRQNGRLVVTVNDDGRGLADKVGNGVGLTNLRERLRALYADRARFALEENFPRGARATMEVPYVEEL